MSYFEHPSYVPLVRESFRLWRELEAASGEKLLTLTGCLNAAPKGPAAHGLNCFDGALASAQEHGLQHEVLSATQAMARFPALRLPEGTQVLYEREAGFLAPEKCIEAHLALAQRQHGAELLCGTKVLSWRVVPAAAEQGSSQTSGSVGMQQQAQHAGHADGRGSTAEQGEAAVEVETDRGVFRTRRLVLAGGGWMPQLVPELKPLLTVERQVVGWFEVAPERRQHFSPAALPVFLLQDEQGYYYGFPEDEFGFKLGKFHHRHEVTIADGVDRTIGPADEEALRQCLRRYFPAADGRLARAATCTFTNTPDGHFILDRHPRWPQVVLASACSGHGFKFAPVIGSILADLALNRKGGSAHAPDIALHRLHRGRPGQAEVLDALLGGAT